jgi:hypothetical protein
MWSYAQKNQARNKEMCHYITATLPVETDVIKFNSYVKPYGMYFSTIDNRSIKEQLNSGDLYGRINNNYCDCGTILGSQYDNTPRIDKKEIDELKKKNWSESKINRWVESKKFEIEKEERKQRLSKEVSKKDGNNWTNFLNSILTDKITSRIGILFHWYHGPLSERIILKDIQYITSEKISIDLLLTMNEDILYIFTKAMFVK